MKKTKTVQQVYTNQPTVKTKKVRTYTEFDSELDLYSETDDVRVDFLHQYESDPSHRFFN